MVKNARHVDNVQEALVILGSAWWGDWSMFDGRTLRGQLDSLAAALDDPNFDVVEWSEDMGICVGNRCWIRNCHLYNCEDEEHQRIR